MRSLGKEVIAAAETRTGRPFRHHFRPNNFCLGGEITVAECMEKGLDESGYDCSGLVIASLCDVLGIATESWPREYRHLNQLKRLGRKVDANPGDILFFDPHLSDINVFGGHMGICIDGETVIHANGKTKKVEQGIPPGNFTLITTLPAEVLTSLATT